MIRLLKKSEVAQAQAQDKAREINEGLKISKKVDALRELWATEEANLEKWRTESLSAISKQISELENEKQALLPEVEALRKEKSQGMEAVEQAWIRHEGAQAALFAKADAFQDCEDEFEAKMLRESKVSATNLKLSREKLSEANAFHEEAEKIKEYALSEAQKSRILLMQAENIKEQASLAKQKQDEALALRESAVSQRENACIEREKETEKIVKAMKIKEIRLVDREGTLKREFDRLQKR